MPLMQRLGSVVRNKAAMDNAFARGTRFEGRWLHKFSAGRQGLPWAGCVQTGAGRQAEQMLAEARDWRREPLWTREVVSLAAESDREITRDFIRRASAIAIAQDGRQNRSLMRFSACGAQEVIGETISNVVVAMERVIERFATPGWSN